MLLRERERERGEKKGGTPLCQERDYVDNPCARPPSPPPPFINIIINLGARSLKKQKGEDKTTTELVFIIIIRTRGRMETSEREDLARTREKSFFFFSFFLFKRTLRGRHKRIFEKRLNGNTNEVLFPSVFLRTGDFLFLLHRGEREREST